MIDLTDRGWPLERTGDAITALANHAGLARSDRTDGLPPFPIDRINNDNVDVWVETSAEWLGFEAEPLVVTQGTLGDVLRYGGPALLAVRIVQGVPGVLCVLGSDRDSVEVLGPRLLRHRIPIEELKTAWTTPEEAGFTADLTRVLDRAQVPPVRRDRAVRLLRDETFHNRNVGVGWLLRADPTANLREQFRAMRGARGLTGLIAAHVAQYVLGIAGWWILGTAALSGRLETGWFLAWVLVLLTQIGLRALATWQGGLLSIRFGVALRQRLLRGALALDSGTARRMGPGHFFGQAIDSDSLERLAVQGTLATVLSVVELLIAGVVLALGAAHWLLLAALVVWLLLLAALVRRFWRDSVSWTEYRVGMTHGLVERLVGHRTRLVQEPTEIWQRGDDAELSSYLRRSIDFDRTAIVLASLAARGWLLIGVAAIGFGAIATGDASVAPVAIALGGVLLVYRALRSMVNGATRVVAAGRAAWQLRALLRAADRSDPPVSPRHAVRPEDPSGKTALLAAHQVGMSYPGRARPVLVDCSVSLVAGDRVLILGPSGAGKTTLASLLSGSQQPTHGLLLLDGMDYASLRGFWRRWVVAVPQFNDNHVFHGSLAFNLLLGREWPPRRQMLVEAEALCRELHLGPLLDKMPAGLEQIVGEVGWQLSHGEQSRLFVARALLQRPDVVILDESFGALDPESLRSCFETVLARAKTLVLIAHP